MTIYWHELKSLRKSTVIWTLVLVGIAALYLSIYPSMASEATDFRKLLAGYPPAIRAMLGIDLDQMTSLLGFYAFIFSFVVLCGAIQAMHVGASILSKEQRARTADFLLAKPVSRGQIATAKLLAALTTVVLTDAVYAVLAYLLAHAVEKADFSSRLFVLITLSLLFVQIIFLTLGAALSVIFYRLKNVLPLSLGVVFAFYIAGALLASGRHAEVARYLSPFQYFRANDILRQSGYEWQYVLAGTLIVGAGTVLTYWLYIYRDAQAVN
ncbi:MAG: ABC transporter permease subunit [Sporolactobacillus sp.]